MAINVEQANALINGGNVLAGAVQGVKDLTTKPQSSTDMAAAILNSYGVVIGLIGQKLPFAKALGAGLGTNLGAVGVLVNGFQLSDAYDEYQRAVQSGNATAQAVALNNLGDKVSGFTAAIGATLAAVPVPGVQQIGLGIWLGATATQQYFNGNLSATLDIIGSGIESSLKQLIGGPSLQINQYGVGTGELISVSFTDQYGLNRGSYSVVSGDAARELVLPTVTITSGSNPQLYYDLNARPLLAQQKIGVSQSAFNSGLAYASQTAASGYGYGNTADFAQSVISSAGLGPHALANYLNHNTEAYFYAHGLSFLFQSSWDSLFADESTTGTEFVNFEYSFTEKYGPSKLGKSKFTEQFQVLEDAWFDAGYSPIAIDLTGEGIHTTDIRRNAVSFDLEGDGVVDKTAWLAPNSGFLVVDLNNNGLIEDVSEMFGGAERGRGYAQLAEFDTDGDGLVTSRDKGYLSLSVWQDKNGNGKSDEGELQSLSSMKIDNLVLNYTSQEKRENGNLFGEISSASVDGVTREMADIYFKYAAGGKDKRILINGENDDIDGAFEESIHLIAVKNDAELGDGDALKIFDMKQNDLWFVQENNDRQLNAMGMAGQKVMVASAENGIELPETGSALEMYNADVEKLVQAMASFAPPSAAQSFGGSTQNNNHQILLTIPN